MPIIIGISGFAGHGKDTLTSFIIEHVSKEFDIRRYAFADELKEEMYVCYQNLYDPLWKIVDRPILGITLEYPPRKFSPLDFINKYKADFRESLQLLGELRRQQTPFYWIRKVDEKIEKEAPKIAIISDLRYQNEFMYVKANGGYTIRVNRIGYENHTVNYNHISETDLLGAKFDIDISCLDGDLDSLRHDAIEAFEVIRRDLSSHIFNYEAMTGEPWQNEKQV